MRDRYASLREGLVGAWIPSVSGSGLLLPDLSGNGNNGALTNMGPEDWVASEYGRALDFDGVNDKVSNIGQLSSFAFIQNTGVFSISAWINFRGTDTEVPIGNEPSSSNKGFFVSRQVASAVGDNSMRINVYRGVANTFVVSGSTDDNEVTTDQWTHWCYVSDYSDTVGQWYKDGIAVNTSTREIGFSAGAVTTGTSSRSLSIGVPTFTIDILPLDGQLDDIRIYNRALSESEIKLLSQEPGVGFKRTRSVFDFGRKPAYLPPTPTDYRTVRVKQTEHTSLREGLVGAWCPSIEGSGYTLPDLSGQGNNGTLTNMGPEDWVSSQYGRALDFDGVNDYVVIGDVLDSVFVGTSAKFSIASWAHPASTEPGNVVAKIADSNFSENQRQFSVRYRLQALEFAWYGALDAASFKVIASTETIPLTTWTHVAVTFNASIANPDQKASLFINGSSAPYTVAFAAGTPVSIQNGTASLAIGASVNTGGTSSIGRFPGQLDDVRIYNRVLSESEIKLLASRPGIGLRPQRRTMYYAPPTGARRRRILTSMP